MPHQSAHRDVKRKIKDEVGTVFEEEKRFDYFTCGVAQRKNGRFHEKQQDYFFIVEDMGRVFQREIPFKCSLYGVVDGHGPTGEIVSDFVSNQLPKEIVEKLEYGKAPEQALYEAIECLDYKAELDNYKFHSSGACVTLTLVAENLPEHRLELYTAWIGDSSVMLAGPHSNHYRITHEHNLSLGEEARRIVDSGGTIYSKGKRFFVPGCPGSLNITRAVGDWWAKSNGRALIIAKPDIEVKYLRLADGRLDASWLSLVLTTDGTWEFLKDLRMAELVVEAGQFLKMSGQPNELSLVADKLVHEALRRGSKDNATAMVIDLHRITTSHRINDIVVKYRQGIPTPHCPAVVIAYCRVCGKQFKSYERWISHTRKHHVYDVMGRYDLFPCRYCWMPLSESHPALQRSADHALLCRATGSERAPKQIFRGTSKYDQEAFVKCREALLAAPVPGASDIGKNQSRVEQNADEVWESPKCY